MWLHLLINSLINILFIKTNLLITTIIQLNLIKKFKVQICTELFLNFIARESGTLAYTKYHEEAKDT